MKLDLNNNEVCEKIIDFGAFGYNSIKIADILGIDDNSEIELMLNDENSKLYKLYQKGKSMYDYAIDNKLFKLAQSGDLKAFELLEQRKIYNK